MFKKLMLIVNCENVFKAHPVIKYLPQRLQKYFVTLDFSDIEEIRLRRGVELSVKIGNKMFFVSQKGSLTNKKINVIKINDADMDEALELICKSSFYACEEDIKKGFITVDKGSRIGICASAVTEDEKIKTLKNISGLNYRIAKEVIGAGDRVIGHIIKEEKVLNTLIISPPGCGKTTMLRDLVRLISDSGYKVSVADERNEIAAVENGKSGFNLGSFCDIFSGAKKEDAIRILVRTMSPDVVVTDELEGEKEIDVLRKAAFSGVSVLASIHGSNLEDVKKAYPSLYDFFECFIVLQHKNGKFSEDIYFNV